MRSLGGDFLRSVRESAGVSQADLARRVGSHQPQVSAWETGTKPIQVAQLAQLLDALGLELQLDAKARETTRDDRQRADAPKDAEETRGAP
jgi:transcriptional regulator with XRE-family HTH domain